MTVIRTIQETTAHQGVADVFSRRGADVRLAVTSSEIERDLLQHELVTEALDLLREKLSAEYYYHNLEHTKSVIINSVRCAELDGATKRDLELIAIAAAWHDTGYIVQKHANEPIAARMVHEAMRRNSRYLESEITDVVTAILDTQVHFDPELGCMAQTARGRISPWLLDGDLSTFGDTRFVETSLLLLREFTGVEVQGAEHLRNPKAVEFLAGTVRMLNAHRYLTTGARTLFDNRKLLNVGVASLLLAHAINGTTESLRKVWDTARGQAEIPSFQRGMVV